TPHDVKTVAPDILRHRVLVTYEAEAANVTGDTIVRDVLANTDVP
ncbi:MAG: ATPase, partial [Clostridia bacterium]|nr:ATPase [Deltaproteobacteria bacterium]